MSTNQVAPAAGPSLPASGAPAAAPVVPAAPAAPAAPLNAIQRIELEIQNFVRQREQLVAQLQQLTANVHATEGAIQGAQHLLGIFKAEAAKAEAEVAKAALAAVDTLGKADDAVASGLKKL
jgi:hypothetical protein